MSATSVVSNALQARRRRFEVLQGGPKPVLSLEQRVRQFVMRNLQNTKINRTDLFGVAQMLVSQWDALELERRRKRFLVWFGLLPVFLAGMVWAVLMLRPWN